MANGTIVGTLVHPRDVQRPGFRKQPKTCTYSDFTAGSLMYLAAAERVLQGGRSYFTLVQVMWDDYESILNLIATRDADAIRLLSGLLNGG